MVHWCFRNPNSNSKILMSLRSCPLPLSSTIRRFQFNYNSKFQNSNSSKKDCIQYYVLPTSVLKWQFCGSRFLFSPRNLYFWFGFDLRNKNNIAVDNIFTLDSTLISIVQLEVEKKWYPISKKDSKKESEFRAYSNMKYIVLYLYYYLNL